MKKLYAAFVLALLLIPAVNGQLAMRQAGLRSGYTSGIFIQGTSDAGSAETGYHAMLSFSNGLKITVLRVIYETSLDNIHPDLFLSWGYGGHAGFIYTDHYGLFGEKYYYGAERFCPVFGADGWLSAEYRFHELPVNISLNIKPFVELTLPSFVRIIPWDLGLSISYSF